MKWAHGFSPADLPSGPRALVLLIHGTSDPLVPYDGSAVGPGARDGLAGSRPVEHDHPHTGTDSTRAHRASWGEDAGPQVAVITIDHGGHVEPSPRFRYGALCYRIVGPQSRDLESAEEAWSFFRGKTAQAQ